MRHGPRGRCADDRGACRQDASTRSSTRSATTSCGSPPWSPSASPAAPRSLLANDLQGAQALIEDDDELDALAHRDRGALLPACSPCSSRWPAICGRIVTAIRLTSEIERSGDLMVNVAKGARRIYGVEFDPRLRGLIERMSEEAHAPLPPRHRRLRRAATPASPPRSTTWTTGSTTLHKDYIEAIFESHHAEDLDLAGRRCSSRSSAGTTSASATTR